jgi:hypothetical protein
MLEFRAGYGKAGATQKGLEQLQHAAEFMISSHVSARQYVAQVRAAGACATAASRRLGHCCACPLQQAGTRIPAGHTLLATVQLCSLLHPRLPPLHTHHTQVGDGDYDHAMWRRPEDITTPSTVYTLDLDMYGGSDLLGGTAAALAAISMVMQPSNAAFGATCLAKAKALYTLATEREEGYILGVPSSNQFYS